MAALPAQAPDFTLDHILGHSVSLSDFRGRTLVVVFGGRDSAEQVKQGIRAIRAQHQVEELPIIGVSDLRAAPRAARIIVKSQLKKAYEEAVGDQAASREAAGKEPLAEPSKGVVMLMDWKGEVVDAFGLSDVDKEAVGVVVGADGQIRGSGRGAGMGDEVMAVLNQQ